MRAYVFVTESRIADTNRPDVKRVEVTIKNTGQTPAFDVTHWQNVKVFPYPDTPIFPGQQGTYLSTTMLGPGMETEERLEVIISPSDGGAIMAETKAVYVWGEIKYKDAFKTERHTRYRFMQVGDVGVYRETLTYCEDGNEAT